VNRNLLEVCDKSQVVLGDSAVSSEASGRCGNGKTGIHIRSASGLDNRKRRSGCGSSRHGRGCKGGEPGLETKVVADDGSGCVVLCVPTSSSILGCRQVNGVCPNLVRRVRI
jgi:hypothetical protein